MQVHLFPEKWRIARLVERGTGSHISHLSHWMLYAELGLMFLPTCQKCSFCTALGKSEGEIKLGNAVRNPEILTLFAEKEIMILHKSPIF